MMIAPIYGFLEIHPFTFFGASAVAAFAGELFLGAAFFDVAEKPVLAAKTQTRIEVRSCFMQLNDVLSKIF